MHAKPTVFFKIILVVLYKLRQFIAEFDFNQDYENVQFVHVLTTDYYRPGNPYKLFPKRGLSEIRMTFSLPLDICQPESIIMTVTEGCWSGMVNVYFNGRLKVDGLEKHGDNFQRREITLKLDGDDILQRNGNNITIKLREDAEMVYWLSDAKIEITPRVPGKVRREYTHPPACISIVIIISEDVHVAKMGFIVEAREEFLTLECLKKTCFF
jgi:hypothetical protein